MHVTMKQERFSLAYLNAIAAKAGVKLVEESVDNDSIDGIFRADWGLFGNALNSVLDNLISIGLQSLTGGLFGGGGGIGKLFGFANGGIAAHGKPLPTFARGGVSGSAAIFGEAGPEAAVPLPDGRSIPVKFVGAPGPVSNQNQKGGGALTVHVSLDSDMLRAEVTNTAGQVVARAAPTIVRVANDNAPAAAAEAQLRRG